MFSNLTPGNSVYILSTKDGMKYNVCPVEIMKPSFSYNFSNGALVDITVTIEGQRKEFAGIQANASVSQANGYILTDTKEAMVSQIENILQTKRDIVDNIETHKKTILDCENILKKLNPSFAKEQAMDTALTDLSSRVDGMQAEFGDIKNDMKQILNLLTNRKD